MVNIIETAIKFNSKLAKRDKTEYLVLHHTASIKASINDVHKWHINRGWAGIGYHFLVRKDGTIFRGRPIDTIGAHTIGYNNNSVSICAEGNFETELMSEKQRQAIADLIKYVKEKYPNIKIVRHKDVYATACPGKNYPLDDILNKAKDNKKGIVTASALNFRREPKISNNIINVLTKNTVVEIISENGEWLKIKALGKEGYVNKKYVKT